MKGDDVDAFERWAHRLAGTKPRWIATTLICLAIVGLGVLAVRPRATAATAAPLVEVVPTQAQQALIIDLIAEQKKLNDQKQFEISGAVRMVMRQQVDPETKQVGLDPAKWGPVPLNPSGNPPGVKFVHIPQPGQTPQDAGGTPQAPNSQ